MNFDIPAIAEDYRVRIAGFVERELLPLEADSSSDDEHGNITLPLLKVLRTKARAEGRPAGAPVRCQGARNSRKSAEPFVTWDAGGDDRSGFFRSGDMHRERFARAL